MVWMGHRCIEFFSVTSVLDRIPGEFKHEQNADQAEDNFCNVVLNDECETSQRNDGPGCVTHQRSQLDEQCWDKSACRAASYRFGGNHAGRRTKSDGEDKRG